MTPPASLSRSCPFLRTDRQSYHLSLEQAINTIAISWCAIEHEGRHVFYALSFSKAINKDCGSRPIRLEACQSFGYASRRSNCSNHWNRGFVRDRMPAETGVSGY